VKVDDELLGKIEVVERWSLWSASDVKGMSAEAEMNGRKMVDENHNKTAVTVVLRV
jgi:hypothetical protein